MEVHLLKHLRGEEKNNNSTNKGKVKRCRGRGLVFKQIAAVVFLGEDQRRNNARPKFPPPYCKSLALNVPQHSVR